MSSSPDRRWRALLDVAAAAKLNQENKSGQGDDKECSSDDEECISGSGIDVDEEEKRIGRIKKLILDFGGMEESVAFAIEKKLFISGMSVNLSQDKVSLEFFGKLYPGEAIRLDSEHGMPITVVDPNGRQHPMTLENWDYGGVYALVGEWEQLCRTNGLEEGKSVIQLWCFRSRYTDLMCFLLLPLD